MDVFTDVFGFVAAVCLGIIILTLFFTIVNRIKRAFGGVQIMKLKGFIKDGKLINLHLTSGKTLSGVRFVGFTDANSGKGAIPYQLSSMLVCESSTGDRLLIRADTIRMIEEISTI